MSEYQKWQMIFKIALIIAIVGAIALGSVDEGKKRKGDDTVYEKIFKISAFFMVIFALVMYLVLPHTKIAKHFKMNESLFVVSHILGIICGGTGLIVTFLWQQMVVKTHLFEFLVIFFGLVFVYWAMILKARRTVKISDMLDEKQIDNIVRAGAVTLYVVACIMIIMFFLSSNQVFTLEGKIWFLFYFFITLLMYSACTLYYFRKA
jgi:hypothetical protein